MAKFVPSYGDKPNDVREVAKCELHLSVLSINRVLNRPIYGMTTDFRHQFKDIFTRYSPEKRPFYAYMTSVTVSGAVSSVDCGNDIVHNYRIQKLQPLPSPQVLMHPKHVNVLLILSVSSAGRYTSQQHEGRRHALI